MGAGRKAESRERGVKERRKEEGEEIREWREEVRKEGKDIEESTVKIGK